MARRPVGCEQTLPALGAGDEILELLRYEIAAAQDEQDLAGEPAKAVLHPVREKRLARRPAPRRATLPRSERHDVSQPRERPANVKLAARHLSPQLGLKQALHIIVAQVGASAPLLGA